MIELRGIAVENRISKVAVKLITLNRDNNIYKTLLFPEDKPLNKGQIVAYIAKEYRVSPGDVFWPSYIVIPV